ncbi:hypothetical protein V2J09_015262 [Rumex salicifolius]
MESHTCKLCNRSFRNGRSLGGHMRSHNIHQQPLTPPLPQPTRLLRLTESTSHSPSPSCSEDADTSYGLRENPKRSVRLIDPEFSLESETDSSKIISHTRPRSTRSRRRLVPADEDLAFCLIMLSRDHWRRPIKKLRTKSDEGDSRSSENTEEEPPRNFQKKARSKKRSDHQCPVCHRVFATGQALGGHKRAHFNAINSDEMKKNKIADSLA